MRTVIVTGAAAGIGRETARRFAREGMRVACWDITETGRDELLAAIASDGGQGLFATVDVTDPQSVTAALNQLVAGGGGVNVLINNAGIVRDAQLIKWKDGQVVSAMTDEQWDAVIDVNLKGVFNCTRAVVPHMIRAGGGVIVSASSMVGVYGNFGQTNYTAAKAGVIAMTRTWARELGRYNIRVNAIAPGFVETEILSTMPDKVKQNMRDRTPIGRIGTPADIAEAYVWLASDSASFVHGAVLSVDGGLVNGT